MYYQNYEDYMRAVLGYANNDSMYTYDSYYPRNSQSYSEGEELYPEIYKIVNPVVEDMCSRHLNMPVTEELVKNITDEVYNKVEKSATNSVSAQTKPELKNGDVRNPNAKSSDLHRAETRQKNFLLNDLIRILILRNLLRPRAPMQPPFTGPRPPYVM